MREGECVSVVTGARAQDYDHRQGCFGSKKSWVYKVRRSLRQPGFKT